MARPPDVERRRELLDALVTEFAKAGIGDRSLREIAAAVGTSHRMLLHHFGSREGLMVAIVQELEARQAALAASLDGAPATLLEQMWVHLRAPELRPFERLFFECYARGANGEAPFDRLLPAAVDSWLRRPPSGVADPDPQALAGLRAGSASTSEP